MKQVESSVNQQNFLERVYAFLENRPVARWLLIVSLAYITWIYFGAIDDEVVGFTHDDGVYLIAGKALAEGKGFILEHVVGQPAQVKYPILYPLILALGWKIYPQFPENLYFLTAVTTSFTIAGLYFTYRLFRLYDFPRLLSIALIWMIATNFYFFYYGTSIMSEGPYYCISVLLLYYACRIFKQPTLTNRNIVLLIGLSVLTFHARIIGLSLISAISVYLFFKYSFKDVLKYTVPTVLLTVLPWAWWIIINRPEEINAFNYPLVYAYSNYGEELWAQIENGVYFNRVFDTFSNTLWRLLENMFNVIPNFFKVISRWNKTWIKDPVISMTHGIIVAVSTYALVGYFLTQIISWVRSTFKLLQPSLKQWRDIFLSVPALYLVIYCLILILWGYPSQPGRFLLMLSPLLWLYFFKPLLTMNNQKKVGFIVLFCFLSLIGAPKTIYSVDYIRKHHWIDSGKARTLWKEYQSLNFYINNNLKGTDVIGAVHDTAVFLYTGNPTYMLIMEELKNKFTIGESRYGETLLKALKSYNVKYLVVDPQMNNRFIVHPQNLIAYVLLNEFSQQFELVFQSPLDNVRLYRIVD